MKLLILIEQVRCIDRDRERCTYVRKRTSSACVCLDSQTTSFLSLITADVNVNTCKFFSYKNFCPFLHVIPRGQHNTYDISSNLHARIPGCINSNELFLAEIYVRWRSRRPTWGRIFSFRSTSQTLRPSAYCSKIVTLWSWNKFALWWPHTDVLVLICNPHKYTNQLREKIPNCHW